MKHRVRFGCRIFLSAGEPFNKILERARFCENQDFDSVLIDDHLLYGTEAASAPEPFTTVAAIASRTEKIRVGIVVTDLVRRHPAIVAQTLATLANHYGGRIFLGLGAGDPMNQAPFGMPTRYRFEKLEEGLSVMRLLWKSSIKQPQNHKGRFFKLNRAYLQAGQESRSFPPVYLAAFGPKMLRLTGEAADGWIPHCHTPKTYRNDLDKIEAYARRAGRQLDSFVPAYYALASVSKNRAEADRNVLGPAKYFLALIPEALGKVDLSFRHPGRVWESIPDPRKQREAIREIASTIPDQDAFDTVIHGSPDDCIQQIKQYHRMGCQEFMLTFVPSGGLWSSTRLKPLIRFFATGVMSQLKGD